MQCRPGQTVLYGDEVGSGTYVGDARSAGGVLTVAEFPLDAELVSTLSRRSRRRLRDIQTNCQVKIRLDKAQCLLNVQGTEEAIQAVRRQLESLGGPRKQVPTAVWAELMRTRTTQGDSPASVTGLQKETGCRVHIERSRCEVRLFGSGESVWRTSQLIDALADQCTEEVVPTAKPLPAFALQALAHQCQVTLLNKDTEIVALGLKAAVAEAAKELSKYAAGAKEPLASPAAAEKLIVEEFPALVPAKSNTEQREVLGPEQPRIPQFADRQDGHASGGNLGSARGTPLFNPPSNLPLPFQKPLFPIQEPWVQKQSKNQGRASGLRSFQGTPAVHLPVAGNESRAAAREYHKCPTCGTGRFCVGCGMQLHALEFQPTVAGRMGDRAGVGMPDVEAPRQAWASQSQQVVFMPYDGTATSAMALQGASAPGSTCVVPAGMVPMCFPAVMMHPFNQACPTGTAAMGTRSGDVNACVTQFQMQQAAFPEAELHWADFGACSPSVAHPSRGTSHKTTSASSGGSSDERLSMASSMESTPASL